MHPVAACIVESSHQKRWRLKCLAEGWGARLYTMHTKDFYLKQIVCVWVRRPVQWFWNNIIFFCSALPPVRLVEAGESQEGRRPRRVQRGRECLRCCWGAWGASGDSVALLHWIWDDTTKINFSSFVCLKNRKTPKKTEKNVPKMTCLKMLKSGQKMVFYGLAPAAPTFFLTFSESWGATFFFYLEILQSDFAENFTRRSLGPVLAKSAI